MTGLNKISKVKQIFIKNIWFIINFTLGFLIGYGLGIIQIHKIFLQNIHFEQLVNLWIQAFLFLEQLIWKPFSSFSPSFKFVSDVIAYQAAIVAIAIPVSLDIISRISERYQSGIITKEFNQQWQLRTLLTLVITDSLLGVILKFFVISSTETVNSTEWKIVTWIILLFFMATNIVLFAFFNNLRKYATSTKFLLDRLFSDLDKNLKQARAQKISNIKLITSQERIIGALDGIGDILIFKSRNKKNIKLIRDKIWELEERVKNIFELQKTHPEIFQRLMYSEKFLRLNNSGDSSNELALAFSLEVDPEENVALLGVIVNQLIRIYETSIESNNFEVAQWSTYCLKSLLKYISQISENYPSIKVLLKVLYDLNFINQNKRDDLVYPLALGWYIDIVPQNLFELDYQKDFDNLFVQNLRGIVSSQKYKTFESFLNSLNSAGGFNWQNRNSIGHLRIILIKTNNQEYIELISNSQIEKKIDDLEKTYTQNRTVDKLKESLSLLEDIRNIINYRCESLGINEELRDQFFIVHNDLISAFKFNHIIDILFDLGAYCIFKDRYDYLHKLWNFKQPADSDAIWVGSNFLPPQSSLEELISFYFKAPWQRINLRPVWENHHGSELYYNQYFLILLLHIFLNSRISTNLEREQIIKSFNFSKDFESSYLNGIKYITNQTLIPLAMNLNFQLGSLLQILGFDINQLSDAIQYGLIAFLESLTPKVDQQLEILRCIGKISPKKIEGFEQDFLRGYDEEVSIQGLFNFYRLYESNIVKPRSEEILPFGLNHIDEKSILFEDWYVDDGHIGFHLGNSLATSKNSKLIIAILQSCATREDANLRQILSENLKDLDEFIIVAVNMNLFEDLLQLYDIHYFKQRSTFEESEGYPQAFAGLYIYEGHEIPLFSYFCHVPNDLDISDKSTLILNKKCLGKLVQYAPDLSKEAYQLKDYFGFKFEVYSDNQELMNQLIEQPPAWLSDIGDELQQKKYLESRVSIEIHEKFNLEIDPNFLGFCIPD